MSNGSEKVCVVCREDCAGRPRVKDKQGRYVCRACLAEREASRGETGDGAGAGAGAVAVSSLRDAATYDGRDAPSDADIMSNLVDEAVAHAPTPCGECGVPTNPDSVICLACGYNKITGRIAKTRVSTVKAPKEKGEKRRR